MPPTFSPKAFAPEDLLLSIIQAAGWPIWPLILCSVAALALVLERLSSLRRARVAPDGLIDEVITVARQGTPSSDMLQKLADNSLLGAVLAAGLKTAALEPRISEAPLRQALETAGSTAAHRMERYLNALSTIASVAPLLGLLGTVIGMIEIFGAQAPGSGTNPAQLAHGISVALYNTAFGLIVAIPSLMAHRYFRTRIADYLHDMEQASERLLQQLLRMPLRAAH
ncbi:MotA/TolQ/ExbB proton channel family protein [Ideonella azotifigens]|uniref:MotA/TolQ/ExbB proton channel family protein n=1 Tax=Ideonella azotifigens TaxID=513160 RepID=A0ABP3VL90_9BURK